MKYTLNDLYIDLNIFEDDYKEFRKDFKKHAKEVVKEINKNENLIPCFESDLQREMEFLEEINCKMEIHKNIDGVILYKKVSMEA